MNLSQEQKNRIISLAKQEHARLLQSSHLIGVSDFLEEYEIIAERLSNDEQLDSYEKQTVLSLVVHEINRQNVFDTPDKCIAELEEIYSNMND